MGSQVLRNARKLKSSRDELIYKRLNWRLVVREKIFNGFSPLLSHKQLKKEA
jgi:hypothetical protein